eukprot:SM000006S19371  [mRNA]  locus=s6:335220:336607:- [translate_table: standard]
MHSGCPLRSSSPSSRSCRPSRSARFTARCCATVAAAAGPGAGDYPAAPRRKAAEAAAEPRRLPEFQDLDDEDLELLLELEFESGKDAEINRHYEIMFLVGENHLEEVPKVVKSVQAFVDGCHGKTWRLNDWGLRTLAYPIQKQRRANYVLMNVEIPRHLINELEKQLMADERIVRQLITRQKAAVTQDSMPPPQYNQLPPGEDTDEEAGITGSLEDGEEDDEEGWDEEDENEESEEGEEEGGDGEVQGHMLASKQDSVR